MSHPLSIFVTYDYYDLTLFLLVWDHRDSSLTPSITIEGYIYFPLDLDVADDGYTVLTSSKGFNSVGCEGRIWDLRTQKQVNDMDIVRTIISDIDPVPLCSSWK